MRTCDRRSRPRTPSTLVDQVLPPVVEEFLEKEGVDVGLLAPQHHQHDHLEHFEVDRRFIGGERALDHDLALCRRQLAGVLEELRKPIALVPSRSTSTFA